MGKTRVALSIDESAVKKVDLLVKSGRYHSRSEAIEALLKSASNTNSLNRLATEAAKLNPEEEIALAEEGLAGASEDEWPEY